jgi:hypothetical protein
MDQSSRLRVPSVRKCPDRIFEKAQDLKANDEADEEQCNILEQAIRHVKREQGTSDVAGELELGERIFHLVQEEDLINYIHACEMPPDEYYDELKRLWTKWWPGVEADLLDHLMSVLIAFDTATCFAMSFGVAKFALAQVEAKLVGEIVGRNGRRPNPAIIRAIKKWPPIYTLKQLQEFLGTVNYVRPHAGPEYCRIADPLRALLKPDAVYPPNAKQNKAIEDIKELVTEHHTIAVPDEAAAILAASSWLMGRPPAGRPYELGADTSGYAIGGLAGQCSEENGKLKVLLYISAHLADHQQFWHPFEQEFWGLLHTMREKNKQLGRIPAITHTQTMPIYRDWNPYLWKGSTPNSTVGCRNYWKEAPRSSIAPE